MGRAHARVQVAASIEGVEALWYDLSRWPTFVDGFDHVVGVDGDWPRAGATLRWESSAGGRGRVDERVVRFEPGGGQEADVEDPSLRGTQAVAFAPSKDGRVVISLELRYALKRRSPLSPVLDLLFIRRAIGDSLRRTLVRFAQELGTS